MNVQYISERPSHVDNLYKTGEWETGETKEVPDDVGRRMVKHADVYSVSRVAATSRVVIKQDEPTEQEKMQETYDLVNAMTEDSIRTFVKTQFNRSLDGRIKDIGKLRAAAINLVDMYGVLK